MICVRFDNTFDMPRFGQSVVVRLESRPRYLHVEVLEHKQEVAESYTASVCMVHSAIVCIKSNSITQVDSIQGI